MTLSRTWYTDANVAISDPSTTVSIQKSIVWGMKSLLKGVGSSSPSGSFWTVESSSTGAAFGAGDLWGDTYDASKIVWSTGNHSWIVLKSPNSMGPYYLCMDLNTAGPATTMVGSKTAFTGGSISARPTATNEFGMGTTWSLHDSSTSSCRLHKVVDDNGNFWLLISKSGSGLFLSALGMQTLVDTRVADTSPVFLIQSYMATSRGAFTQAASQGPFNSTSFARARTYSNSGVANACSFLSLGNASTFWLNDVLTPNAVDGSIDTLPIYIYDDQVSFKGVRGRLPDCGIVGEQVAVGSTFPRGSPPEQVVVGHIIIPYGSFPNL